MSYQRRTLETVLEKASNRFKPESAMSKKIRG